MKKFLITILTAIACIAGTQAQTFAIYTHDGMVVLCNPDEAGEMIFSGNLLSVGNMEFDLTEVDSMTYTPGNFDPQLVQLNYEGEKCIVRMPLALMGQVSVARDGAYATVTSTLAADPEVTYEVSGITSNGAFVLEGDYKCGIRLNGVNIASQKGAAVHIKNGKRIDIELVDKTTNTFADLAGGLHDACFQVKGHPEFKGAGTLNITGNANHAYKSGEYTLLKRSTGEINISGAVSDAMHIGQYFEMRGGKVNILSGVKGDGIQVEKSADATKENNGLCKLDSGIVNINLASDDVSGIKTDSILQVNGGTYNITVSGKAAKGINVAYDAYIKNITGAPTLTITASGGYLTVSGDKKKSACFKADRNVYFHAGTMTLTASGDKARGLKVGNDYYYVPAKIKINVSPDVTGAMRVMSE